MFRNLAIKIAASIRILTDVVKNHVEMARELEAKEEPEHIIESLMAEWGLMMLCASRGVSMTRKEMATVLEAVTNQKYGTIVEVLPERHRDFVIVVPVVLQPGKYDAKALLAMAERCDGPMDAIREHVKLFVDNPPLILVAKNGEVSQDIVELVAAMDEYPLGFCCNVNRDCIGWALIVAHLLSFHEATGPKAARLLMHQHRPSLLSRMGLYDITCDLVAGKLDKEALAHARMCQAFGC